MEQPGSNKHEEDTRKKSASLSDGELHLRLRTAWIRWPDIEQYQKRGKINEQQEFDDFPLPVGDLHLHRYCDVIPKDVLDNFRGETGGNDEGRPTSDPDDPEQRTPDSKEGSGQHTETTAANEDEESSEQSRYIDLSEVEIEPGIRFVNGLTRRVLQYTPTITWALVVLLLIYAEVFSHVEGISTFLTLTPEMLATILVVFVIWSGITLTLVRGDIITDLSDYGRALFVYGLIAVLLVGTVASLCLVLYADPQTHTNNVIFASGYLLLLLIGGCLFYDGILRTESLFGAVCDGKLDERKEIINSQARYDEFVISLDESLTKTVGKERVSDTQSKDTSEDNTSEGVSDGLLGKLRGVPISHCFAVLVVTQFLIIWLLTDGPQNLNSPFLILINTGANIILLIIFFRFLILVSHFNGLLVKTYYDKKKGEFRDVIASEPFHVDRYGGFRDYGRFATRVNVLLLIGCLYLVYRLYVQGLRALPDGGLTSVTPETIFWVFNYVGPLGLYLIAVIAHVYYSFWSIHRKMLLDKERGVWNAQGVKGQTDTPPHAGDSVGEYRDGPDWYYLREAPEWPVNNRWLLGLVSANLLPLFAPLIGSLLSVFS